ncbi:MAG: hypothetical protein PWP31_1645 [Clostridia bacterium]|nr:hypothetical protein [Clostridia bacterium]
MIDLVQKAFALGLGAMSLTREAAEKLVEELVRKGEIKQEQAGELVNELLKRGQRQRQNIQRTINEQLNQVLSELNLPTRDDLLRLEEKVDRLLQKYGE